MRVVKENSQNNTEVGLKEFTKTEIASLFPATELLHKIHNDHVYTSTDYKLDDSQEIDDSSDDNSHHEDDILSLNADSIQQVFQRMVDMTSLDVISDQAEHEYPQEVTIDANEETSSRRKSNIKKVKFVDELPGASTDDKTEYQEIERKNDRAVTRGFKRDLIFSGPKNVRVSKDLVDNELEDEPNDRSKARTQKQGRKAKGKRTSKLDETKFCKSVSNSEWKTVNRYAEVERELNTLIQYTAELLVRRWGEYLMMTTEQISKYEIENAKQHKMIKEVVEMLEDKDRYVWQLIDELRFF